MVHAENQIEQLEHKVAILKRLAEISAVLNSTLELNPLLAYIMDEAAQIAEAEGASVLLWDEKRRELRFSATNTNQERLNLVGQAVPLTGSIAGTVMLENRIVEVDDVADDPRHFPGVDEAKDFETRSILAVPMTSKDHVIGVLEVVNKRQLPWTLDDHHYLSILAAQAAVAIEVSQLVTALQKANVELSEVDKLKTDFIAIASHELRTPLGIILGYSSFLHETSSDGKVSEQAAKVLAGALQLRGIIEQLTNLRFLQQGEADLQRDTVTLDQLLQDTQHDMLSMASAKGHEVEILPPPENVSLFVDQIRLVMALTNILNNAIRFTPDGGRITVQTELHNDDEVWISVTDTGIGLAEDHLERIFDKFYQVEDHMTRVYGGLGIGLSIAKALIEAHGGRIWASSPGLRQGTTVTVSLPLAGEALKAKS
jgi:signal transduction histidine kinase